MIAPHPFGTEINREQLITLFAAQQQWEDRYRQLILLSRRLPALPEELKQQQTELKGCENRVWLGYQRQADGRLHFYGDSEGRIVKGLLAVLLTDVEGLTAEEILARDPLALFDQLGIRQQLSSSRSSGLQSLADAIEQIARREAF